MEDQPEIETSPAGPRRLGLLILLVTFGGFGLWSFTAPLHSAALAPGKVVVKGSRRSIEHLEGGIIAELLVRDGDIVEAGEMLIRLDDTQAKAQLEMATGQHYALEALEARLLAERDNAAQVSYPAAIVSSTDPRARDAIASQNQVFQASRSARLGEIDVLQHRSAQLHELIKGTRARNAGKLKLAASYLEEITDLSDLLQDGYTDRQRLRELERALLDTEGEIAEGIAAVAQQQIQIGETHLEILQIEKQFHTSVVDQVSKTQIENYDLEERIRAAADRATRTRIFSPVSGVVVGMSVTTLGEVITPGETLLYVVPQSEALMVQARVNPVDIDRVYSGQAADIRFSAFNSATTAVIAGRVTNISADALSDEKLGTSYYVARVELTPAGAQSLANLTLLPGMPAEVLINTGSRTLFQYLSQPIRNAFARALIED